MLCVCVQVYKEAAETEIGKKGHEIGSRVRRLLCSGEWVWFSRHPSPPPLPPQIAEDVKKTADEVSKTDVGQVVKKVQIHQQRDLEDEWVTANTLSFRAQK